MKNESWHQPRHDRCRSLLLHMTLAALLLTGRAALANETRDLVLDARVRQHVQNLETIVRTASDAATDLDGQVVVVTFFASWCPPCRDEFKALNELQMRFTNTSLRVIAINVFEQFDNNDEARMSRFLQETAPQFAVVKGTEETLAIFGGVNRIPTLFAFDRSGKKAFDFIHKRGATKSSVDASELANALEPLL